MPEKRPRASRALSNMPPDLFAEFWKRLCASSYASYGEAAQWTKEAGHPVSKAVITRFVNNLLAPELRAVPKWIAGRYGAKLSNWDVMEERRALLFLLGQIQTRLAVVEEGLRAAGVPLQGDGEGGA